MKKLITLSLLMLLLNAAAEAQFARLNSQPAYNTTLSTIIESFQSNYYGIQGQALPPDEDRNIFESAMCLPGASRCVIYRFFSKEDTTAGWQAVLYNGDDEKEAIKQYNNAFRQLKKTKIVLGMYKYSFDGVLQAPDPNLRFTSSLLRPDIDAGIYKNFIAEVEMVSDMFSWEVRLNLHCRKDDAKRN